MHEVVDGGAFAQEFRIGADGEVGIGSKRLRRRSISRLVPTGTVDLVAMTVKPSRCGAISSTALKHEAEIGMSVAAAHRRADGEKDEIGSPTAAGEIGSEGDAPHAHIALQELVEARLVNRHAALAQLAIDLARVFVDASDRPAEFRKASGGDQADIACPDHRNVH